MAVAQKKAGTQAAARTGRKKTRRAAKSNGARRTATSQPRRRAADSANGSSTDALVEQAVLEELIDALTGAILFTENENEHETIWNAAISPDGQLVAFARGPQVIFYSLQTFKQYKTSLHPAVFVQSMTFVPNTPLLITAGGGFLDTTDHWTRPHGDMPQIWKLPQPLQ